MKKIRVLVAILLCALLMVALMATALADGAETESAAVVTEFFSWATLATYAGAVLFATLVTQFVKKITWLQKVPTQVICYVVAVIGLLAGTYFSGALTINAVALCFVNGLVVTVAANGTYDNITVTTLSSLFQNLISDASNSDDESTG